MADKEFLEIEGGFYRREAVVAVHPVEGDDVRIHLRSIKDREHIDLSGEAAEKALEWARQKSRALEPRRPPSGGATSSIR